MKRLAAVVCALGLAGVAVVMALVGMVAQSTTSAAGQAACVPAHQVQVSEEQQGTIGLIWAESQTSDETVKLAVVALAVLATEAEGSPEGLFGDGERDDATAVRAITEQVAARPGSASERVMAMTELPEGVANRAVAIAAEWVKKSADTPLSGVSIPDDGCSDFVAGPVQKLGDIDCVPTGSTAERGLKPAALAVLRCTHAAYGPAVSAYYGVGNRPANSKSDHPAGRAVDVMIKDYKTSGGRAAGESMSDFYKANSKELKVKYIIYYDRIWSVARANEGWRPYRHPSGATDDTSAHRDHVHISVLRERQP